MTDRYAMSLQIDARYPRALYLSIDGWGRWDEACPIDDGHPLPAGATDASTVQYTDILAVDADGWPHDGGQRYTRCCAAAATFHDADLCCKSCYGLVDDDALMPPRLPATTPES